MHFRRALRELDAIVYDIIRRFRSGQAENADSTLLGAYLAARYPETGEGMSDTQPRDELITLCLAGHETTASLLTWALYRLGRHPDIGCVAAGTLRPQWTIRINLIPRAT